MSPELKAKWVEALRSGEYAQIRGSLMNLGGYCCLGVLMTVARIPIPDGACSPTPREQTKLGLEDGLRVKLENMNDGGRGMRAHSFTDIADWIEANL